LPPIAKGREKVRLRNQLHSLNLRLDCPVIRFFLDGTGAGICWKPTGSDAGDSASTLESYAHRTRGIH
jgi:hypothetical protein